MRWYYPFSPSFPDRLNAWKRQDERVDLATSGGHRVRFRGLRMYPDPFRMRHYLYLSVEHATQKYIDRAYDAAEVEAGWHRRRAALRAADIELLPERTLREYVSDDLLDPSGAWIEHPLFAGVETGTRP